MENAKKLRKVQRSLFTKCLNAFTAKCQNANVSQTDRHVALQLLEARMAELDAVNAQIVELLIEEEAKEEDIQKEIETHEDTYKIKFLTEKAKLLEQNAPAQDNAQRANQTNPREKPFKRPTLEIPKFSGCVSKWLPFWSHFRKIHEDKSISKEDKLEYLKQAVEKGSKAENVVEGFPTTAENYEKAFNSLKSRFGRDDLLVEFYTRELLSLVLQNASNKGKKISVSSVYDKVSAHIRALETLGVTTDNCATMLYPLVESSLPEEILRTWQRSAASSNEPAGVDEVTPNRLSKLLKFLEAEVENEERFTMAVNGFSVHADGEKREKSKATKPKADLFQEQATASVLFTSEEKRKKCIFCKNDHENALCEKAKKLTLEARKNVIKENGCCFKCLKHGHRSRDCKVKVVCSWCGYKHSILVCTSLNNSNDSALSNKTECSVDKPTTEHNLASFCNLPDVYLQTLRVVLYSENREKVVRAVIDGGSQRSYVRADIARFLGYESKDSVELVHSLFGGVNTQSQQHDIFVARMKSTNGNYACNFNVMSKPIICTDIPSIKKADWFKEVQDKNIYLCDVDSSSEDFSDSIGLLIGADVAEKLKTGKKYDLSNGLTVLETRLGWTVTGKIPTIERKDAVTKSVSMFVNDAKVEELWSLDVLGIKDPAEKSDQLLKEKNFKENFLKTVSLNDVGRYSVDLPWIEDHAPVSRNFDLASKRLDNTVKKLKRDGYYDQYNKVFSEWYEEGIIEFVPDDQINTFAHYLPHRPVIKPGSTTPTRPVYDASASEKGFPALNQCLEKGTNLIELVPSSLLRFREHEIAVIADIRKAFLQIEINEKDRDFLRFLWMVNGEVKVLRHKRLVFGLTCSPFILGAVLELHFSNILKNNKDRWSREIVQKLSKSFYVDNCTTSVKSLEEVKSFISQGKEIMATGGFDLRGWEYTHDLTDNDTTLVLGILYNKARDTISINPAILSGKIDEKITKRSILSMAHKVFDPIGFTCPVTLLPKLMLKNLYKQKMDWDASVDEKTKNEYLHWYDQLNYLNKIEITRKFGTGQFSLHTFCDASQLAYAAVTFLRVENENGVHLVFLSAKSRVAPENTTTPRLELLAASIGSRQTHDIIKALGYDNLPVYYWSDSTTVLTWLNNDKQWGIFVWNRVREIRQLTSTGTWKYVPGELNPADLPSRGCQAKTLYESRWWEGPSWLRETQPKWPSLVGKVDENEVNKELKKSAQISMINTKQQEVVNIIEQFSSYNKMIRFFCIMIRFKDFLLKKEDKKSKMITYREMYQTEINFLKCLQKDMFLQEEDPKLTMLQTFVHTDGLIRLKTKIFERDDKFSFLCPIVLDYKHKVIELLIRDTHEDMCHAGVQTVMCQLREKFWIISMRKAVRSVISKCIICKKQSVKHVQVNPAPLPIHRVKKAAVFEVTGVDFAGPVILRGQQKGWICLFTCAVYRAVHLDIVTSLSTKTFLDCLRRFIGMRGRPKIVYSDNGTNFTGADNAFGKLNWNIISKFSTAKRIEWRFNPPSAPWWGGWWERLIGLLKQILRKVLGKACLDYQDMRTVLSDCQVTLNSRPLTYISGDPDDLKTLTPAMFLHDLQETETPDLDILDKIDLNSEYERKQEIMEHLRKRFRKEYLSQLVSRTKIKESRQIKVGDLVLIGDDSHKRIDWPVARIEKLIVGRDGIVRVVELKTKEGQLKRPIQRIYPLEINNDSYSGETDNLRKKKSAKQTRKKLVKKQLIKSVRKTPCKPKNPASSKVTTRSGRIVKKPVKFKN